MIFGARSEKLAAPGSFALELPETAVLAPRPAKRPQGIWGGRILSF